MSMLRRLVDLIAAWLGYTRVGREIPRIRNGTDAIARGERWESFYAEEGGLRDMLDHLRRQYFEASAALGVSELDKHYEYALADRIARELDREVRGVIETGKLRIAEKRFTDTANLR